MIRVGFIGFSGEWHGGQNYLRNLLYAISQIKDRSIEPVVFLGPSAPKDIIDLYAPHAEIVVTPLLERYRFSWWIAKVSSLFGRGQGSFPTFLLKNNIQALFWVSGLVGFDKIKILTWIPDFQHKHLKDMFSASEIISRDKSLQTAVFNSDRIILSSQDALKDLAAHAPQAVSKARVLNFVGQVDPKVFFVEEKDIQRLKHKYGLPSKFFYLPNQFWKHKNHIVVFEAVYQLKGQGISVPVVCSGLMQDSRHPGHIQELKRFIDEHGLDREILFLGKIPLEDVYLLYAASLAVINPSLFEGWSTTVEECKTLGKRILLSDLPVHREQQPAGGVYFDPHDQFDLAKKIKEIWLREDVSLFLKPMNESKDDLKERTMVFGKNFQQLVMEACQEAH